MMRQLCSGSGSRTGSGGALGRSVGLIQRFVIAVIEDIRFLTGFSVFTEPSAAVVNLEACRIRGDRRGEHAKGLGAVPVADVLLLGLAGRSHVGVAGI